MIRVFHRRIIICLVECHVNSMGEAYVFGVSLDLNEVHLWIGRSDELIKESLAADDILSVAERQRANRFLVDTPKRRYIGSVLFLRQILARYLTCLPHEIQFHYGSHGKPFIKSPAGLKFNLSHSHERVLVAVAREQEVGVDIEYHKERTLDIIQLANRFFAEAEFEELMQFAPDERFLVFYRLWTRKEAFIKATGEGLSFGLDNFVVSARREGMDCLLTVHKSANLAQQWSLGPILQVEQGYTAALAAYGAVKKIQFKQW